jgi:hypothetical protein
MMGWCVDWINLVQLSSVAEPLAASQEGLSSMELELDFLRFLSFICFSFVLSSFPVSILPSFVLQKQYSKDKLKKGKTIPVTGRGGP